MSSPTSSRRVDAAAVVDAFTRASVANDNDAIRELMDPGLQLWHNFSNRSLDREQMLRFRTGLREAAGRVEMASRLTLAADGCIRENVARGVTRGGRPFLVSYLVLFEVTDEGRISRMTEFYDSAQLQPFFEEGWNPFV